MKIKAEITECTAKYWSQSNKCSLCLLLKFKYHSVFAGSNLIRRYRIEPWIRIRIILLVQIKRDLNLVPFGIFGILNGSKLEFDRLRFETFLTLNSKTVKTNVLNKLPPRLFSTWSFPISFSTKTKPSIWQKIKENNIGTKFQTQKWGIFEPLERYEVIALLVCRVTRQSSIWSRCTLAQWRSRMLVHGRFHGWTWTTSSQWR